jgi:ABC-type dipeptide/oligopeptide/nickel transport system ATPase component
MSTLIGVVGSSGTGKSTSFFPEPILKITGLDPKKTFVINVSGKPFPFKGWRNSFLPFDGKSGNYLNSENANVISKAMLYISENRPEITNIIVDDFQYLMGMEFVEKAMTKGYDKFSEIAMHAMQVLNTGRKLRDNIKTFILAHSEEVDLNFETTKKIKTIGKFLDEKIELPGLFTVLLYTKTTWHDQEKKMSYEFVTNRDVSYPAKSPYGMFKDLYIPNDLGLVARMIDDYETNK